MNHDYLELKAGLARARSRWRRAAMLNGLGAAAGLSGLLLVSALGVYLVAQPTGVTLIVLAGAATLGVFGCFAYAAWRVSRWPNDRLMARFMEERVPELEDRVVTAVEFGEQPGKGHAPAVAGLLADAVRHLRQLDFERIVSRHAIKRAGLVAGLGVGLLVLAAVAGRTPALRASDTLAFYVFPSRMDIDVQPGHARVTAGESLRISAHVRGGDDVVTPVLEIGEGEHRQVMRMSSSGRQDEFAFTVDGIKDSFTYRVSAALAKSPTFAVRVLRPPHVTRIDLSYQYPPALRLKDRVEEDGGDIYGPVGTAVKLRVTTDRPVTSGEMVLANGARVALAAQSPQLLEATMKIARDDSYRLALDDVEGLRNAGETEYFIRTLSDRPPDVRIVHPNGDQEVTRLQEVTIDARADDDYGIAQFDLVYAVGGGPQHVVPLKKGPSGLTSTGTHTLFLEDLSVQPGDFVSYFARARDVGRGRPSTEARSDIFFLEVKPYEEEYVVSDSQSSGNMDVATQSLEELAKAQKDIIVATWKLDRRALDGTSGQSAQDVLQIARAQGELQNRARQVADQNRSPANAARGRGARRPVPPQPNPTADALAKAVDEMGLAKGDLQALKTAAATPHEMEALNEILKAQAEDRRRQISRSQQASSGASGSNRSQRDLSSMFDRELRRQQETNYETPATQERKKEEPKQCEALDKVRDLARRQAALGQQQRDLAGKQRQMPDAEVKRQLERLTREQSELRQQAEDLSRELSQSSQSDEAKSGQDMRDSSEEMRNASADLRRGDPRQAAQNSDRALDKLKDVEGQMGGNQPDAQRRAMGDLSLEARQLADAQRGLANEAQRLANGKTPPDALRRLSGDQERLADRLQQMERSARKLASAGEQVSPDDKQALSDAANDMDRQQLERRMRDSAATMRTASEAQPSPASRKEGEAQAQPQAGADRPSQAQAAAVQDNPAARTEANRAGTDGKQIADVLDNIAKRLGSTAGRGDDAEVKQLSGQLAQAQKAQEQLKDIERRVEELRQQIQQAQQQAGQQGSKDSAQGSSDKLAKLQEELQKALKQGEEMMAQIGQSGGGRFGGTPETQQLSGSAAGTEAYKQDFSKWESLKKDVNQALEQVEMTLARKLAEKESRERLNAGADDRVPEEYRELVEKYYRSLASRKP